ncbi:16S rRNA (adenine(1518)-N(6)/adenine(1519)-N(6))-dimethyltransferase [Desulfuribacillus stibiiarsenatis]|uniref:Ribosomal RNA small subunit methyltransferase A n=1 Tax=Desulfuribacillus stibiiarsenatis TaxID=1390249 RepID=A0A1E5L2Q7_9FIRM|nr:16S rRNA (adenine(1518)-N(6)/adenine(1519)-N(6))-dimethyltransferase RsmA [Desulfuribacillus stibiiarsenatis]OEH84333.1 16S rRNA (adenine(1518)-N(6)/adenine(1519)-N(6))-dimethyltransferase [Desulfuribacillus stibiiarsenatis]
MTDKQLYSQRVIREIMDDNKLHFKKSLGQNFLTDLNILQKIVAAADVTKESTVIEIGPGIGTLTQQLANAAGQVIAIELDQRFLPILNENFWDQDHVSIIHGDALTVDLHQIIKEQVKFPTIHVVANLPYYVTTPILMKLLEEHLPLTNIVVMIQKEVAQRIQAQPGTKEYGALSIAAQYYAKPEIVCIVPKTVFIPEPNVDSAVIRLSIYEEPKVKVFSEEIFFAAIKAGFANRRKTLWNNFKGFRNDIVPEQIRAIFEKASIDEKRRGETLSIEEYAVLSNEIHHFIEANKNLHG